MNSSFMTVGSPPSDWVDYSSLDLSEELGPSIVTHDPKNTPDASTAGKVGVVFLAFLLCLTVVGIPLAAYLLGRVEADPPAKIVPMDSSAMYSVFQRAVAQHTGEGYISAEKATEIGQSHDAPKSLSFTVQAGEDIGAFRPTMEDAKFHLENGRRLVMGVFDGHGGSSVSKFAAEKFKANIDDYVGRARGNVALAMQELVNEIHNEVLMNGWSDGTTAVISYLDKASNRLYTATLGDSEANIYREVDGQMVSIPLSLTQNWTLESELERLSKKTGVPKEEILAEAYKQQLLFQERGHRISLDKIVRAGHVSGGRTFFDGPNLSRAIGDADWSNVMSREVEVTSVQVKPGDTIILACDGLKDFVKEKDIVAAVKSDKASPAELIELAKATMTSLERGDNVTVITVKVEEPSVAEEFGFDIVEEDEKVTNEEVLQRERARMLAQIKNLSRRLGSETVIAYAEHLQKSLEFKFVPEALRVNVSSVKRVQGSIEEAIRNNDNMPVFVPVILERGNDHIVLITIDPLTKQVEYFDSQGKAIEVEDRKIKGLGLTPQQLVDSLKLEGYTMISNSRAYQKFGDWVNCGVYVSQFMKERAEKTFEDACSAMIFNPKLIRPEMAKELAI